jgi:hypothetical protein
VSDCWNQEFLRNIIAINQNLVEKLQERGKPKAVSKKSKSSSQTQALSKTVASALKQRQTTVQKSAPAARKKK